MVAGVRVLANAMKLPTTSNPRPTFAQAFARLKLDPLGCDTEVQTRDSMDDLIDHALYNSQRQEE